MKKLILLCLLLTIFLLELSCSSILESVNDIDIIGTENMVAVIAVFDSQIRRLVLFDYYDPTEYKFVTDAQSGPYLPKFSHNKLKLLYNDFALTKITDSGDPFVLYDVIDSTIQPIKDGELYGIYPVWNFDGSGFFFASNIFGNATGVRFYSFLDQNFKFINTEGFAARAIALINDNTLLAESFYPENQTLKYVLIDISGHHFSVLNNPHMTRKNAGDPDWNSDLQLFVYSDMVENRKRKICVTNLNGSYYRSYTSGEHYDVTPVWGPEGETILFLRSSGYKPSLGYTPTQLMIIDCERGYVNEFIKSQTINNAVAFYSLDF